VHQISLAVAPSSLSPAALQEHELSRKWFNVSELGVSREVGEYVIDAELLSRMVFATLAS
jgi:hypothetical protein